MYKKNIKKYLEWTKIIASEDRLNKIFQKQIKNNFIEEEQKQILTCLDYIKEKHKGQTRRDDTKYYTHPLTVALFSLEYEKSLELFMSALLHDVLEDSPTPLQEIEEKFNEKIAHLVNLLSKSILGNKKELFEEYYANIKKDKQAQLLKACDRLANLHSLYNTDDEERKKIYIQRTYNEILPNIKDVEQISDRIKDILMYLEKEIKLD